MTKKKETVLVWTFMAAIFGVIVWAFWNWEYLHSLKKGSPNAAVNAQKASSGSQTNSNDAEQRTKKKRKTP